MRTTETHEGVRARVRAVDVLMFGYVAFVSAVAAVRIPSLPQCGWVLAANGLVALLIVLVLSQDPGGLTGLIHDIYPILLLVALYGSLDLLNGSGRIAVHDAAVQRWEAALFGGQPSRDWWRRAPSELWSTVLHGTYFAYYGIIAVPTALFALRPDRTALRRFVLGVTATFLLCYVCFIFFPVAGPYYAFPRPSGRFVDNPTARLVYATLAQGSSYGAAFPSSHVAASVAATVGAWRGSRALGVGLLIATALLTVGVVYCQMHYAVDALAGVGVGLAVGIGCATRR